MIVVGTYLTLDRPHTIRFTLELLNLGRPDPAEHRHGSAPTRG